MKKSILIALLFSLVFLMSGIAELGRGDSPTSNTSNTVEVTLLGPKQYIRTNGKPNIYTNTFPGRVGQGKLIVKNGEGSGANRISSAIVKINGTQIFGPNDFNQNVYEEELSIALVENNTISVELRSKPGSYLTIEIKQQLVAESGAVIGAEGGSFEVENAASPLFGVRLVVPQGAVNRPSIFLVNLTPPPPIPLPNDVTQDGEAMSFTCSGQLAGLVMAEIPFPSQSEDQLRLLFYYDENMNTLNIVSPLPSPALSIMRVALDHFSTYVKGTANETSSSIHTTFLIPRDCLNAENNGTCEFDSGIEWKGGICSGMSLLAEAYFKGNYGELFDEGLFCHWPPDKAYPLACAIQGRFFLNSGTLEERMAGYVNLAEATALSLLSWSQGILVEMIKNELRHNRPVSITMAGVLTGGKLGSLHTSLVIGWEKIVGEYSERLVLYDVNDPNIPHYIYIKSINIFGVFGKILSYSSGKFSYNFFGAITPVGLGIEDLITSHPSAPVSNCPETTVFFSNFDDGTLQGWGTIDYSRLSSERAYSGNYSIKVNDILAGGNEAEVYRIFQPGVSKGRAELRMYIPSGNSAGISIFLSDRTYWEKYPSTRFQISFETNGQVYWNQGGWHQYSNKPIVFDTWNKVILSWDCATNEMTLNINGYDYGRAYNNNLGGSITQLTFQGMCWICTGIYAWFDDIKVVKY
jgi:hypothetical protein